jgi:hypothetical protein
MHYEIRVRGRLGPLALEAFPLLEAGVRGRDTVLSVADRSALFGVLYCIESLGFELLEVRAYDVAEAAASASAPSRAAVAGGSGGSP